MKKILMIGLVTALTLTGCNWGQPDNNVPGTSDATQNKTSQDFAYKNAKYGFTLTIPSGWEKYKVESVKTDLPAKAIDKIGFKVNNEEVFNITVHPKADWAKVKVEVTGLIPIELAADEQYTFAYSVNQGLQSEQAKKAMGEVEAVVKTFALKK